MALEIILAAQEKMQKSVLVLKDELATLRAGRANPKILDRVVVDYYGTATPLNQVANISSPEPRLLVVAPWDQKLISSIEKAMLKSDIGITPTTDGKVLRLLVPELTEERRKELVKTVKKYGEDSKIGLRNIRRDVVDKLEKMKKDNQLTEDDLKDEKEHIQKVLDKISVEVDKLLTDKEKEILSL